MLDDDMLELKRMFYSHFEIMRRKFQASNQKLINVIYIRLNDEMLKSKTYVPFPLLTT